MRRWRAKWLSGVLGAVAVTVAPVCAQEEARKDAPEGVGEEAAAPRLFQPSDVIHPVIAKLPPPVFHDKLETEKMVIYSSSREAQRHVLQGMALIQAAWDFEAYRHFCEAVKLDPDCVMAYWGIGLALAAPNNEFSAQRMLAVDRMLDLVEALGDDLPEIEREYAVCLALLFSANAKEASAAFAALAERFPQNLQATLLATYLKRDGYTEFGDALYGQEVAIEEMKRHLIAHPDSLSVLTFWVMLHAETPDADRNLRQQVLPYARKLARLCPDFPPYQHLLGHFEWRCGNLLLGQEAFERAADLYAAHMKRDGLSFHDCAGWARARLYLTTALYSQGKFDEAMAVAKELAGLKVEAERLGSDGANLVVWEGRTLPARLYLARGKAGDFAKAIATLPGKDDPQLFKDRTLSVFYLEGLRQYLGGCQSIAEGDLEKAGIIQEALSATGGQMLSLQRQAMMSSSISQYLRAVSALEVHLGEYRGKLAMAGPAAGRRSAFNWFKSAVDRQMRPSMLMPPPILYPLENRLAEYFLATREFQRAAETYQEALARRPNDLETLLGYQNALLKLERRLDAAAIQKQIDRVRRQARP